ncbi:MAG TPA: NADH-quinone oxidoreductase subunit NuoK [Syntrophobacteraceae bacterium]|nr:NADH-quinone oxidoreductase subunit NuoK [Syntrophobacteraceae bacterium]
MNNLSTYLIISALLFSLGLQGILLRRNLIGMLISVELLLNAANLNFMAFNRFLNADPVAGQVIALFVMGLAAAEAAIGLSIILALFRTMHSINIERAQKLRG